MYTLWVIEKPAEDSVAARLMGDHAVRVFGSLRSFEALVKFGQRRGPDAVVVNPVGLDGDLEAAMAAVSRVLGDTPVVAVDPVAPHDPLAFNRRVRAEVQASGRQSARRIRYKDVTLDCAALKLAVAADGEPQELPLKEAQLLRLFIERPGICLSRDEIKAHIWQEVKVTPRTIDSHVARLRQRLGSAEATIESIYGRGYLLR